MNIALYQQLQSAANGSLLPAILLTILLGVVHALSPGHGKTLIVASMLGSRAGPRRVLLLAVTVAATHTIGVLLLALVVTTNESLLPQDVTPYISLVAAILVVVFGADLTRRGVLARAQAVPHSHEHPHAVAAMPLSRRYTVAVGLVGGLVPNLTALVVLTIAITFHEVLLGVLLVLTFGLGIAVTLVAIGFAAMLIARRGFRIASSAKRAGRVVGWLPIASGVAVVIVGCVLTVQAVLGLRVA